LTTNIKDYFPETVTKDTVTRSFILKVIFHKDVEKFKTLESIAKSINKFKSEKSIGGVNVSVPKQFLEELGRFESNMNTNTNSRVYSLSNSVFMKSNIQVINLSKEDKKIKRKKDLEEFMKENNIIRNYHNLEDNN
jgi:predicted transcriptional regulator